MSDLEMVANSASKTSEEMDLLYSPSRWCRRMSTKLVVDYHCNIAHNGYLQGVPEKMTINSVLSVEGHFWDTLSLLCGLSTRSLYGVLVT